MKRVIIAGTHSGCGKTAVTCALLQALVNRGLSPSAFKCGPDYIDPMFHSRVIGLPSRNLDPWFCDRDMINCILHRHGGEISVIEGVMGFYDGVGEGASTHALTVETGTPTVIVADCKGMSLSIGAEIKGFLTFREPNNIVGFIFNRLPESLVPTAKSLCEELGTRYLGRLPYKKELSIESRRLGLVTAGEISDIKQKLEELSGLAEENILIEEILSLGAAAVDVPFAPPSVPKIDGKPLKIAVARDRAFCFYYEDNLDLLREMGCELAEFSPLSDGSLPENIDGLLLGGGYPELYAAELAANIPMLSDIRGKILCGLPTVAECGGFMYLCKSIGGHRTVGVIDAEARDAGRLRRFGYVELRPLGESPFGNCGLKGHEFHYWDVCDPGGGYAAVRARDGSEYFCAHTGPALYAGFPHLYLYSNPTAAANFVKKCQEYKNAQT